MISFMQIELPDERFKVQRSSYRGLFIFNSLQSVRFSLKSRDNKRSIELN
jgi:hypothetical protein